ncbi:hypothetical protein ACFSTI_12255 [Rhizorhabdus histidinilytica]
MNRLLLKTLFPSLLLGMSAAAFAATEQLSIVSNGETVGSIVVEGEGDRATVDYRVDNNGRGPKHREELTFGAGGIPTAWTIKGTSLMGGTVDESYRWSAGRAQWSSQADQGSAKAKQPPLYVVNDDSPYAIWVYARAALAQPDHSIAVLPAGRIALEQLRTLTVGEGDAATEVTAWRLTGVQLNPSYLLLDKDRKLFALFGPAPTARRSAPAMRRRFRCSASSAPNWRPSAPSSSSRSWRTASTPRSASATCGCSIPPAARCRPCRPSSSCATPSPR